MKARVFWRWGLAAAAIAAGLGAVPTLAERPSLAMLDSLEPGLWQLRSREPGDAPQRVCLGDARRLIQLRHAGLACDQLVVSDAPAAIAVQYTCRGQGYGLTRIRRETRQLIQIESQGVVGGLPFDFALEGRRIGDCAR